MSGISFVGTVYPRKKSDYGLQQGTGEVDKLFGHSGRKIEQLWEETVLIRN